MLFETCGGMGFASRNFAPTKPQKRNPLTNYLKKRYDYRQQKRISELEAKAKSEGLTKAEKLELAAQKLDSAIDNTNFDPVFHTASGKNFCCTI